MKKLFALLLAAVMMLGMVSFATAEDMQVAMITDYGDITDQSFNQTTYEACKAFCESQGIEFTYYKPAGDNTADRVAMVDKAYTELGTQVEVRIRKKVFPGVVTKRRFYETNYKK